MKIDDPEYHFKQSAEFEETFKSFVMNELYTCSECGNHFDNKYDLTGGVCGQCWQEFELVETGH